MKKEEGQLWQDFEKFVKFGQVVMYASLGLISILELILVVSLFVNRI